MKPLIFAVVLVVVLPLASMLVFERVPPMDIGVRQSLWGGGGISQQDFGAGTYLGVTGVHKWHYLPRRTHFLHFTGGRTNRGAMSSFTERGVAVTRDEPPMELRTKDNNQTSIDVTVPFKIIEGEGWKIVDRGLKTQYFDRVKSTVENVLRAEISQLGSEDLQSTELRLARASEVLPILNKELAEFHVQAEAILIRAVSFPPEYEAKLQEKQFFTQKALLDGALALQAEEEQVTNSIDKQIAAEIKAKREDWNKRLQEETSRYEVLIAEINAAAQVYESRVRAEGDATKVALEAEGQLALDQAAALRDRLRNEILNSEGGSIFLALEAASNLNVPKVMLNSNDPRVPVLLDLQEMADLLLGQGRGDASDG